MTVDPKRTIAELKELRALTADDNGAQRVAWTRHVAQGARVVHVEAGGASGRSIIYDAAGNHWITLRRANRRKRCSSAAISIPCPTAAGSMAASA